MKRGMQGLLDAVGVHCRDRAGVLGKLQKMSHGGASKLQVISDFDHTLSCYVLNGRPGSTTHGVLETASLLPESYRKETQALKEFYYPLDYPNKCSLADRIRLTEEWFSKSHDLLLDCGVNGDMLASLVAEANIGLRDHHGQLFSFLAKHGIPLTIFSGGLTNIISIVIGEKLSPNMTIVANRMIFDDRGHLVGFSKPLIHSYNKRAATFASLDGMSEKVKGRDNVILLGDHMGDHMMANGLATIENIVKVGYLNHEVDDLLSEYLSLYDVVITGGSTTLELPYQMVAAVVN